MSVKRDIIIGFFSGLAVAIGGAIKDAPYEGFDLLRFIRSPIIGAIEAPIIGKVAKRKVEIPILFFATIGTERLTVETYKLIRARTGQYVPGKFKHGEWGIRKTAPFACLSAE